MWYFAWVLGIGFAVLLAIMNALWGENEEARAAALFGRACDGKLLRACVDLAELYANGRGVPAIPSRNPRDPAARVIGSRR